MKRLILLLPILALCAVSVHAQSQTNSWTYVQNSVITYCANNTSSCSGFAGTMVPPLGNSVWVFVISTTNDVTATVSGGGATWTECANCSIFLSGFRRNRVFYAFGGTAGSTAFTINLSGNSGASFAVSFEEVLPPSGTTASFDVGGAVTSSSCVTTCTGVPLTLTGTDVALQFMKSNAPADYKGWPSPYQTLPNGTGIHLNAVAGTESAPVVNVTGTGAVFSAIAFKSSGGSFTPATAGPMSLVSFVDPDPASGLTGLNCAPNCNLTVPATGSGHLLYLEGANTSGVFIGSVTGGGTWVVPAQCQIKGGQAPNNALSCAYVLSSSPGATTVAITMAGTANTQFAFYEVATTTGVFSLDTVGTATNAASTSPSGVALTLTSGVTDAVFQSIFVFGGTSSVSYFPLVRGCRSGCGPQFWNGQAASDAILNATSTTLQTPRFSNQQNNSTVVAGIAFKVTSPVINAASCSSTDVQAAFNTVAADNTTVVLPVCLPAANTQWSSTVTYNKPFSVIVQGQGSVATTNAQGNPATYSDQTVIFDMVSNSSLPTLAIATTSGKSFRMTGVSFLYTSAQVNTRNIGVINVTGNSHSFRMDNNHFNGGVGFRFINIGSANVWGVIDHNLFDMANGTNVNMLEINGANYNGSGDSFGDTSWTDPANFGTGNFLFAENNTFTTSGAGGIRSFDIQQGGRLVFRYNTAINAPLQTHAIGHDGPTFRDRGPRAFEVYNNVLTYPTGGPFAFLTDYEGGTSLYWGNTASGFNSFLNLDYRRATGFTYSQVQPPNGWGYCGSIQTGPNGTGPSVWDQNIGNTGWACLDGAGRGKGDLLAGSTWPNVTDAATGTQTWPKQAPEPMYIWSNSFSGGSTYVGTAQNDTSSAINRDYFVELPNPNNAATFNGTSGVGNGTLAPTNTSAYSGAPACTAGVGYWQSTSSTLFTCNSTWGAMDEWLQMNVANSGSTVTSALLASGSIGTPAMSYTLNPSVPTGLTFSASQGSMGGSITIGGVTYPVGTPTQAISLSGANNFTYADSFFNNSKQQVVANGFITFGAANAGSSGQNWDLVLLTDTVSAGAVVLQLNNGQPCYCVRIETNGAGGFIGRSANITLVPGGRYAFSLLLDEVSGVAQLAMFDPATNFSQVGATVTQAQPTGNTFTRLRLGNAEIGTSTGATVFEDVMLDWTVHKFPNAPTPTWTSYYSPFPYPHPLTGASGTFSISASPSSLSYGNSIATVPTTTLTVTETNSSGGTVTLSSPYFTIFGPNAADFTNSGSGTCSNSRVVASGSSCTVVLFFTPSVIGVESATLSLSDNGTGSPHQVTLLGSGLDNFALSATSANFFNQLTGTTGAIPIVINLTNIGLGTINMTSFIPSGDFTQTNDCGTALVGGGICHLSILFAPTITGARAGGVALANTAAGGTYQVSTSGTGIKAIGGNGSITGTGQIKVAP